MGTLFADNVAFRITELFRAGESAARTYAALPFVKAMNWEVAGPYFKTELIRSGVFEKFILAQLVAVFIGLIGTLAIALTSVTETSSAVHQISKNIKSLADRFESQATNLVESSAAIEQMVDNIRSVTRNMERSAASTGCS